MHYLIVFFLCISNIKLTHQLNTYASLLGKTYKPKNRKIGWGMAGVKKSLFFDYFSSSMLSCEPLQQLQHIIRGTIIEGKNDTCKAVRNHFYAQALVQLERLKKTSKVSQSPKKAGSSD
jgi:hypothetical protein